VTAKRWPRPLYRGDRWIEVSNTAVYWQINRDFGKWPLDGGWPLNRWPLSRGQTIQNIFRILYGNDKCWGNTCQQVSVLFQQLSPILTNLPITQKKPRRYLLFVLGNTAKKIKKWTVYFEYQNVTSLCSSLQYVHRKNVKYRLYQ